MVEEHGFLVRQAVRAGDAEQQDALAGLRAGVRLRLHPVHDDIFRPADSGRGPARLNDQYITIRQHIQGAWIREAGRERLHLKARRDGGCRAVPTDDFSEMERRHQVLMDRWQIGVGADLAAWIYGCGTASSQRDQKGGGRGAVNRRQGRFPSRTPTPWRYTMVQPFQAVTSRIATTSAERIKPVGTTDV